MLHLPCIPCAPVSDLADAIKRIRGNVSQRRFAKLAGIGFRTLCKIELDEDIVKLSTILGIAEKRKLKEAEKLDLIRAWIRMQLGDLADHLIIDLREPSELHDREPGAAVKLMTKISNLPARAQNELLKAVDRPEVLNGIRNLNEMYERLRAN